MYIKRVYDMKYEYVLFYDVCVGEDDENWEISKISADVKGLTNPIESKQRD
jgi:hypothetical protein